MSNWIRRSTNRLALSDVAVTDVATVIAYYRLTHSLAAQECQRIAAETGDPTIAAQAEYHGRFDAALSEIGANLRADFCVFKLSLARQFVESQMKGLTNRRAKQLTGSPGELLRVNAITQGRSNSSDDTGVRDPAITEGAGGVDSGHSREDRSEGLQSGQRAKRKRS